MNQILENYWANVNQILKDRKMSMAELSRQSLIPPSSMHDLKDPERNPGIYSYIRIAETLEVDFARLFTSPDDYRRGSDHKDAHQLFEYFYRMNPPERENIMGLCKFIAEHSADTNNILQIMDSTPIGSSSESVYLGIDASKEIAENTTPEE